MSPLFEALSEEYASSEVVFGKVNIDDHGLIAKRYDIASVRRIFDGFRSDMSLIPSTNF